MITKKTIGSFGELGVPRAFRGLGAISIFVTLGALCLVGCTGEHLVEPAEETKPEPVEIQEPVEKQKTPLYLTGYVAPYGNADEALTRAFTIPEGYVVPTEYMPIGAYFTRDIPGEDPQVEERRILHSSVDNKWYYTPPIEIPDNDYQLYGFMPYNSADVTITPNTKYADGATLYLRGMNIVSTKDVCVMVGAKHGTDAETPVSPLLTGNFDCHMFNGAGTANYLFLLFDHLYASISFRFSVAGDYAKLRTIHLKKLQLTAYTDAAFEHPRKREVNATVVLRKTTNGSSPIQSITFEENGSELVDNETFFNDDIELTPVNWSEEIAYVPYTGSYYYVLRSTYDVYDKKGNLIRLNSVAENKINLRHILNISDMQRGKKYVLKLTIRPTYLYQLSDQDLDNPSVADIQ